MFYLSKYVELLDTLFVVLRGSAVPHFGLQVDTHYSKCSTFLQNFNMGFSLWKTLFWLVF